jgi:prevent-host-death family protein
MIERVQVAEAKAHFSALLERVQRGEEIQIARRGTVVARLVPERASRRSAADVFRTAAKSGGLSIVPPAELPAEAVNLE